MFTTQNTIWTTVEIESKLKDPPTKDYLYKLLRRMERDKELMSVPGLVPKHFRQYNSEVMEALTSQDKVIKPTLETLDERSEMILGIFMDTKKLKTFKDSEDAVEKLLYLTYSMKKSAELPGLLRDIATILELIYEKPKDE